MGKIAEVSWFGLRIDIDAVSSSQVVTVPVTIGVAVDLQDVSSDCSPMPLKESVDVISIERSAPIPAVAMRKWLEPPQIAPSGQSPSSQQADQARCPNRAQQALHSTPDGLFRRWIHQDFSFARRILLPIAVAVLRPEAHPVAIGATMSFATVSRRSTQRDREARCGFPRRLAPLSCTGPSRRLQA